MIALESHHPSQLCFGAVLFAVEKANARGQALIESICRDACNYARETGELLREIATDAQYGLDRANAAKADGIITLGELAELEAVFAEIQEEARTGKIIR